MKKLFAVHGDKGGVGKTEVAKRTAAALLAQNPALTVIDGDSKNPGLHHAFRKHHGAVHCVNVMTSPGLEELFEILEAAPGDVILDLPARGSDVTGKLNGDGADEDAFPLEALLRNTGTELVILFVIDPTKAPLIALSDELDVLPNARWVVVRNHREERLFDAFDQSKIKQKLIKNGAAILDLVRLDPTVNDLLEADGGNLLSSQASENLSFIQKYRAEAALNRWTEQLKTAGLIDG